MPQLNGVYLLFPEMDSIDFEEIAQQSVQKLNHHTIENHLANRLLYPQSVAMSKEELDLDFLILAAALKKHPEVFFNSKQNRIVIPTVAVGQLSPLTRLISVVLNSLYSENVIEIWLKDDAKQQLLGSSLPQQMFKKLNLLGDITVRIQQEEKTLIPNQLNLIPVRDKQVKIQINQSVTVDAVGGSLGIFIDLRQRGVL
jgi:hypothetical protein